MNTTFLTDEEIGFDRCPKLEKKNDIQLKEQLEIIEKEKDKQK